MAYTPKEWVCGDTITADDLNRIEEGVADASGVMTVKMQRTIVQYDDTTVPFVCDTPIADIDNALKQGKTVIANITQMMESGGQTEVNCSWSVPISFVVGQFYAKLDMYAWGNYKDFSINHPPVGAGDDLNGWTLTAQKNQ